MVVVVVVTVVVVTVEVDVVVVVEFVVVAVTVVEVVFVVVVWNTLMELASLSVAPYATILSRLCQPAGNTAFHPVKSPC